MVISYVIKNILYLNITNHCTNRCDFCSQQTLPPDPTLDEIDLRLEREPTLQEIISDVSSYNLGNFSEIVFGGHGEPTCRLYDMLSTCRLIKERTDTPIRVNTNGHASMILAEDTAPMFKGLVDSVSISLNAADSDTYIKLCKPKFGENAFTGVIRFAREIVKYVPNVILTVAEGSLSENDIERCSQIASDIGARFRIREAIV